MMGMLFRQSRITSERVRLACRHWTNTPSDKGEQLVLINDCPPEQLDLHLGPKHFTEFP